jgi:hypothetical protein
MPDFYQSRDSLPEVRRHLVRLLGTGASTPTKEVGVGITVTRPGVGRYLLTWGENPGVFVGVLVGLQAATPGDLAGHTVIADTWDASAKALELDLFDGANAAHDLAANEYIHVEVLFKATNV